MKKIVVFIGITLISFGGLGQHHKNNELVNVNGIELYYQVYGEGEPLLLLHGWTQSSRFWEDYVSTYAEHFTVYALDLRGHGKSTPLGADFSIKKTAEDIVAFLNNLNIEKTKAIGLSYGGLTLLELSASHPEKIESMILIGASHNYKGEENTDNSFSYENLPPSFVEHLKELHHHGESQIRALFDPKLDYSIDLSEEVLQAIKSKTLIVHGDRDEILGIEPAFALHQNLPNSELWILPNTGHLAIMGKNRKAFLSKSLQFFMAD